MLVDRRSFAVWSMRVSLVTTTALLCKAEADDGRTEAAHKKAMSD